ncbi:delta-60 repeat domain-containing protein [Tistrella bauzanensis]
MVDDDVIVQRYAADGTLDTGFGTGGTATFGFSEAIETTRSVMIQADGGIIVAGTITGPGGYAVFLYRLDSTGTVDSTFGSGGWAAFPGWCRRPSPCSMMAASLRSPMISTPLSRRPSSSASAPMASRT